MPSHSELAAHLLRNAAVFFRDIGAQNSDLKDQMDVNAHTYETVAQMVENDPDGTMPSLVGDIGTPANEGVPPKI